MTTRLLTFVLGASALSLALLAIGCSGGGGDKLVDPANADGLSHQALLVEKDLPGSGWIVTKSDVFDDSGPTSDTAACKDLGAKQSAAKTKSDAARSGRAEKELSHDAGGAIPTSVETQVDVFKDASTPADVLKLYQDAVKSSNFETCLKDELGSTVGDGIKVDTKSVTPQTSAPNGGTATAYEFSFSVQGETFNLHYETYLWRSANVGVTVTVNGLKDDVTAELVKAAVTKTQSNVAALPTK
jgi:hypothetical protein